MSQPRVTSWTPKKLWSPYAFRAFRLHRVIYTEGGTVRTQVAYPHLGSETKSHLLNFQKQQLIPELCEHSLISAALMEADAGHWNVTNDPVYPACLEVFRRRHESSQDPQANKSAKGSGAGGGSPTGAMTPLSTTSSQPLLTPTLGFHEIRKIICETLDQVYALHLEALQEMAFIREVDRALAKSIMVEFIRLQLIVGDGLNTSLWALHADLKATAADLVRDMDIAAQNSTALPSKNPAIGVALHRFTGLVKLKLALPLAQIDAAREHMQRFLHHHLEELRSQPDMKNLIDNLSHRVAAHQSRAHQIVLGKAMENAEVCQWVILGVAVDQPVESNFFSSILEGLLGRLGITTHGEMNPPTSAKEGAARLWASTVVNAVQKMEKRQVRLKTSGSSGMPSGLHLNYEEDFLNYQSHQVPAVFTDPLFLPNMVNSVYKLVIPPVFSGAPPFAAAQDRPTISLESGDDRDSAAPPSPSPSTVWAPTAGSSKVELPAIPIQVIGKSDTESDKTENLEHEVGPSYSTPVFPPKSDHTLRKWTRSKMDSTRDSKDGAPSPKRATIKKEVEVKANESLSSAGLSDETLHDHRFMGFCGSRRSEGQDPRVGGQNKAFLTGHRLISHLCTEEGSR